MKQGLNKFLWPCVSVTMYNDMEQVCVGCEGIVCSKIDEAYIAIMNFIISNSPKRKRENIYVIDQPYKYNLAFEISLKQYLE